MVSNLFHEHGQRVPHLPELLLLPELLSDLLVLADPLVLALYLGRRDLEPHLLRLDVIARLCKVPAMCGHIDADRGQTLRRTLDALQVTTQPL